MTCRKILLLLAFSSILLSPSFGQQLSKIKMLKQLNKPEPKTNYSRYLRNSSNELEATGALLFLGYKSFFSSQDMSTCVFTPSCSVYAMEAFETYNPFVAYLKTFDRLTRCHPFTAKNEYPYFKNTSFLHDPVH